MLGPIRKFSFSSNLLPDLNVRFHSLVAQGLVSKALKYHETSSRLCKLLTTERKFAQAEINFLMTLKEHVHVSL